jgi:hypothetical protein
MLYEDLDAGNRAMRTFDSLLQHCGRSISFRSDMWKFDTLRCPSIARLAAQDAADADVIIVSGHGSEELPEEVRGWFEQWVQCRPGRPTALVSLLDHAAGLLPQFDPAQTYLEGLARRLGMEFVSMFIEEEEKDVVARHIPNGDEEPPACLEAFCRRIAQQPQVLA